ncbi:YqiA/YcfP family alpha/beta fold hydrolase [Spirulina sp. 06S082]|uniref:YqiA/YcfP family alpha/beta fold hydrolase n=1 Tax=Spirulina sp. 06S082 TaxID=3110248 RepID=UPI002B1F75E1|nr:YqiA/YcfP family alpha/beta fold hydrolase [Spirulina sp. 06S082]MEA5471874.1 YqiA/YcfP family alpha/beta fold hydrolase [Spirulina sp. 06S082]
MYYIYLHGFASSPRSLKARYLCDRFAKVGISLHILDLNQDDFSHLTFSRQLQQVKEAFPDPETPITIIGSSFGGLTAVWLAQKHPQVKQVICLGPAFNFLDHFLAKIGEQKLQQWQETGYLSIYHYGQNRRLPLHYEFITDVQKYPDSELQCAVPTLILHGRYDEVIPIQASKNYQKNFPQVKLIELESNHTLGNVIPQLWEEIQKFCL